MARAPISSSSNPRRAKPYAIRTFPSFFTPSSSSVPSPENTVAINADQKPQPSSLISYRGKSFRSPIAFAIRKFPKGCGPIASVKKSSDEDSIFDSTRVSVRENCAKDLGNGLVGESFGLCRVEGSEMDNKNEEIEEKLSDILRRSSKEGCRLGKGFKKFAVGESLGGKNGEKYDHVKSGGKFARSERAESMIKDENRKGKLNNDLRKIGDEKNGVGKVLKSDVFGGEKDDMKANRKRFLGSDRSEDGQVLEVRGDRLIVLALMTANKCPWMQRKGKGSVVLQSTPKK